jgi:hypothetical protein
VLAIALAGNLCGFPWEPHVHAASAGHAHHHDHHDGADPAAYDTPPCETPGVLRAAASVRAPVAIVPITSGAEAGRPAAGHLREPSPGGDPPARRALHLLHAVFLI